MANLSQYNPYYRLPLDGYGDTLLDYQAPTGQSGSYAISMADLLVFDQAVTWNTAHEIQITSSVYLHADTGVAWETLLSVVLPTVTKDVRVTEVWGKLDNVSPASGDGIRIVFNYVDSSNYWIALIKWNGSVPEIVIADWNGGVYTQRDSATFSVDVNLPALFKLTLFESGDEVCLTGYVFEPGDEDSAEVLECNYYAASRPNKTSGTYSLQFNNSPDDFCQIRGMRVFEQ